MKRNRNRLVTVSLSKPVVDVMREARWAYNNAVINGLDPVVAVIDVIDAAVVCGGLLGPLLDSLIAPALTIAADLLVAAFREKE